MLEPGRGRGRGGGIDALLLLAELAPTEDSREGVPRYDDPEDDAEETEEGVPPLDPPTEAASSSELSGDG